MIIPLLVAQALLASWAVSGLTGEAKVIEPRLSALRPILFPSFSVGNSFISRDNSAATSHVFTGNLSGAGVRESGAHVGVSGVRDKLRFDYLIFLFRGALASGW